MSHFRKKPITIEAIRWTGENKAEVKRFTGPECSRVGDGNTLLIRTLEGVMRADIGDWIIKGIKGEFYPCKPDIFAASYDPVGEL